MSGINKETKQTQSLAFGLNNIFIRSTKYTGYAQYEYSAIMGFSIIDIK